MAALWAVGAVGIYVNGFSRGRKGIWSEIQVIDGTTTTLHWFGAESTRVRLRGHLWGTTNVHTLDTYLAESTSRTLTGPNAYSQDCKVIGYEAERVPDKTDVTNEFWRVEVELIAV